MANDQYKILEKILQKSSLTVEKLCELIEAIEDGGGGPGPGGTQYSVTVEQACDQVEGEFIPIEIIKHFEDGEYVSIEYRDLEGATYSIQGTLGLCSTDINITNPSYNNNEQIVLSNGASFTLAANTYHSISIAVITGTADIEINAVTLTAPAGYSKIYEATTLLENAIEVTSGPADSLTVIDIIN